jgi:L-rhamnose mutarotase
MEGYIQQTTSNGKIKRYVQYLEISDDPALIAEYCKWHSEEHHWKEIRDGIREVGILEMEIYLTGNHLTMIVDTPVDFDWQKAMDRLATLPRQAEWEALVSRFQNFAADARSDEKWQPMERIFRLYE